MRTIPIRISTGKIDGFDASRLEWICCFGAYFTVVEQVERHGNWRNFDVFCIISNELPRKVSGVVHLVITFSIDLVPTGVLTYRRYQLPESRLPKWNDSNEPVCQIHISKNKTIEDMDGLLQVNIVD